MAHMYGCTGDACDNHTYGLYVGAVFTRAIPGVTLQCKKITIMTSL